jgi:pimeloyl-ACP methyl ester carboxylesterase
VAVVGSGPAIVLLHGFPQTHLMWRHVAPALAGEYTVICAVTATATSWWERGRTRKGKWPVTCSR